MGSNYVLNLDTTSEDGLEDTTEITLSKKNFTTFITIKPPRKTKRKIKKTSKKATELEFHFDNIKSILRYSNATPFRGRIGSKYACGYCTNKYPTPAELKDHTLVLHESDKPDCLRILSLSKYIVYLDITNLECRLCNISINKFKDLLYHLKIDHEEIIHMDIKNHIIPFNFGNNLQCVICSNTFMVFEDLLEHICTHYKNYSCDLCEDMWFVNRSLLLDHKKAVHFM
ncbi:zinc finger protein 423 [Papilio machaon]|uniref:zinc finger protein 423 n=1 Tax=Papilio machaon TaxID=76193 RepID=UPI001E6630DF|nr:zinc finger protein 423 [Papilio machaon]